MTLTDDNQANDLAKDAKAEVPRNLAAFIGSKSSTNSFITAMEDGAIALPGEEQVEEALAAVTADSKLLLRVLDLVRGAADERTDGRTRRALLSFGSEIIRSQGGSLAEWGARSTVSSETEIGELARHLKNARESCEKSQIAQAEALLQIGITVASTRSDFDVLAASNILSSNLLGRLDPRAAGKKVQKAFRRASVKTLEIHASLATAIGGRLTEVSAQLAAQAQLTQAAQERFRIAQARLQEQDVMISGLQNEVARLSADVEHATGRLAGVKGGAADDMTKLRARTRQFYALKIHDVLETAESALEIEPPSVRVALERIHDVLSDVRKELAWIDQS